MFFNGVTLRGTRRSPELQATIDQQTTSLKLYQYEACPFCKKSPPRHKASVAEH
jgi:hypothetical protein